MKILKKYLLFLLLLLDTSTCEETFSFSDLMNITDSCYARGKCEKRGRSRLDMKMDWDEMNCFCDDDCIEYGDCCLEAKTYDRDIMKTAHTKYECVGIDPLGSFYMRGKCMEGWNSPEISALCHKASPATSTFSNDPFLDMPATSLQTGITFKNYFCGLCNNETMKDLVMWNAQLSCLEKVDVEETYIKKNLQHVNETWGFYVNKSGEEKSFVTCDVFPIAPETVLHKIRACRDYLGKCFSNWTDSETENLCLSYTTLVYGFPPESVTHTTDNIEFGPYQFFGSFAYRNYHCAICNYIKTDHLTCNERQFRQAPSITPISLSVLFDFGVKDSSCADGEIYNPFSKRCRPVVCLDNQSEFRSGRCVKTFDDIVQTTTTASSPESENVSSNQTGENFNLKCDKMFLNESDFTRTESGIIKLHTFRRTYNVDEYQNYKEGILVCIPNSYSRLMGWLTLVGLGLSCFCIAIHLATFFIVPDLRNLSGKNLASMCIALLIAYVCFLVTSFKEGSSSCPIIASLMYYFFLASFSWMNVMSIDIWRTLKMATSELRLTSGKQWKKFLFYSMYAWILPLILLTIILVFDYTKPSWIDPSFLPELGKRHCWFGQRKAILVYFAAPLAVIMTLNIICFIMAVKMVAPSSHTNNSCTQSHQVQLKLYLRLALLMGLSWICGIIGGYAQVEYFWYVFILFNAFQGLFILIGFTCTKKVAKALKGVKSRSSYGKGSEKDSSRQVLGYQDSNHSHMSNTSSTNLSTITNQSTITSKSSLGVQSP